LHIRRTPLGLLFPDWVGHFCFELGTILPLRGPTSLGKLRLKSPNTLLRFVDTKFCAKVFHIRILGGGLGV